jgi:2-succinyl-6-hydroxy-2,4-cyclohexadiene-1-carboxylate synthase
MWMLLHGFTGSATSWDAVLAHARLKPEPVRPALFGHGPRWQSLRVDSFEDEVSRLCALAASMRAPRLLAGYSLGARVALGMLVANPGLFQAGVLVGVHPGLRDEGTRATRRKVDLERAAFLRTQGLHSFVASWEDEAIFASQRDLPDAVRERQRQIRLGHDAEGLARALDVLGLAAMPSYEHAITELSVPVTLMAGARDRKFVNLMHDLANRSSCVDATVIDGAGHNLLLEAPETVAAALRDAEQKCATEALA